MNQEVKITVRITDGGTTQVLDQQGRKLAELGRTAEQANEKMATSAAKAGAAIGAAFVTGATALGLFTKKAIDSAADLQDLSESIGVNAAELGRLQAVANRNGLSMQEFGQSAALLNRQLAANTKTVQALGLEGLTTDRAMAKLADRFASMPDGPQKTALAMELLGRSGAKLIPALNAGADALERQMQIADLFGVQWEKLAADSDDFNESVADLGTIADNVGAKLAEGLLPYAQGVVDRTHDWVVANEALINQGIDQTVDAITGSFDSLFATLQAGKDSGLFSLIGDAVGFGVEGVQRVGATLGAVSTIGSGGGLAAAWNDLWNADLGAVMSDAMFGDKTAPGYRRPSMPPNAGPQQPRTPYSVDAGLADVLGTGKAEAASAARDAERDIARARREQERAAQAELELYNRRKDAAADILRLERGGILDAKEAQLEIDEMSGRYATDRIGYAEQLDRLAAARIDSEIQALSIEREKRGLTEEELALIDKKIALLNNEKRIRDSIGEAERQRIEEQRRSAQQIGNVISTGIGVLGAGGGLGDLARGLGGQSNLVGFVGQGIGNTLSGTGGGFGGAAVQAGLVSASGGLAAGGYAAIFAAIAAGLSGGNEAFKRSRGVYGQSRADVASDTVEGLYRGPFDAFGLGGIYDMTGGKDTSPTGMLIEKVVFPALQSIGLFRPKTGGSISRKAIQELAQQGGVPLPDIDGGGRNGFRTDLLERFADESIRDRARAAGFSDSALAQQGKTLAREDRSRYERVQAGLSGSGSASGILGLSVAIGQDEEQALDFLNTITNGLSTFGLTAEQTEYQVKKFAEAAGVTFGSALDSWNSKAMKGEISAELLKSSIEDLAKLYGDDLPAGVDLAKAALDAIGTTTTGNAVVDIEKYNKALERQIALFSGINETLRGGLGEGIGSLFEESDFSFAEMLQESTRSSIIGGIQTAFDQAITLTPEFKGLQTGIGNFVQDVVNSAFAGTAGKIGVDSVMADLGAFLDASMPAIEAIAEAADEVNRALSVSSVGFRGLARQAGADIEGLTIGSVAPSQRPDYLRDRVAEAKRRYQNATTDTERKAALDELRTLGVTLAQSGGSNFAAGSVAGRQVNDEAIGVLQFVENESTALANRQRSPAAGGAAVSEAAPTVEQGLTKLDATLQKIEKVLAEPKVIEIDGEFSNVQGGFDAKDVARELSKMILDALKNDTAIRGVVGEIAAGR